jgi:hypothetical protein
MVNGAVIDTTTSRTGNTAEDAGKKGSTQKACATSVIATDTENRGASSRGAHIKCSDGLFHGSSFCRFHFRLIIQKIEHLYINTFYFYINIGNPNERPFIS